MDGRGGGGLSGFILSRKKIAFFMTAASEVGGGEGLIDRRDGF